jgi:hypothetical protein
LVSFGWDHSYLSEAIRLIRFRLPPARPIPERTFRDTGVTVEIRNPIEEAW